MAGVLPAALTPTAAERLAVLFDAHYERLYRLARRLGPTADDALDLVQETFVKAARAPESIPAGFADEEAWLVRMLVNLQRDHWRKAAVRQRHAEESRPPAPGNNAEAAFVAHAAIWSALDALAPRRRAVIVLHELEELGATDVARLLGISAVTVRWHLARGRRELARVLKSPAGDTP